MMSDTAAPLMAAAALLRENAEATMSPTVATKLSKWLEAQANANDRADRAAVLHGLLLPRMATTTEFYAATVASAILGEST